MTGELTPAQARRLRELASSDLLLDRWTEPDGRLIVATLAAAGGALIHHLDRDGTLTAA